MSLWKRVVLTFVAAIASILALAVITAWSIPVMEAFIVRLGPFGAAFFTHVSFGFDLEDHDGGYHGITFVYYPDRKNESARWDVIRTNVTPQQRLAYKMTYRGAPDCPVWGFTYSACGH